MEQLYRVGGTLSRGFVGQITYTVCLERAWDKLDIEFAFDKRRYAPEDVTPALMADIRALCLEKYGECPDDAALRDAILGEMKAEIHTLATLNDEFIGCVHRQLDRRHMTWDGAAATPGCVPTARFEGVLKGTVLVFNVIKDDTRYELIVRGAEAGEVFPC